MELFNHIRNHFYRVVKNTSVSMFVLYLFFFHGTCTHRAWIQKPGPNRVSGLPDARVLGLTDLHSTLTNIRQFRFIGLPSQSGRSRQTGSSDLCIIQWRRPVIAKDYIGPWPMTQNTPILSVFGQRRPRVVIINIGRQRRYYVPMKQAAKRASDIDNRLARRCYNDLYQIPYHNLTTVADRLDTVSTAMGNRCQCTVMVLNQKPRSTQPGHPCAGRRYEYWRRKSCHFTDLGLRGIFYSVL